MNTIRQNNCIETAIEHLNNGDIILYPTDTIWGIGCNPFNEKALDKIFTLKNRSKNKSFILLVDSIRMLNKYVSEIPDTINEVLAKSQEPITIIYRHTKNLPNFLLADDHSIGIRIINHPFVSALINAYNQPLISTSANISGMGSPTSFETIDQRIKAAVDFIIPNEYDTSNQSTPSKILSLQNNGEIVWIRK